MERIQQLVQSAHSSAKEEHLKDYLRVISIRRWILLGTFLLVVLGAGIWVLAQTTIYRAESMLLIEPSKVNLTEFKGVYDPTFGEGGGHLERREFLETQYRLILSRPTLERTFEHFKFGVKDEFRESTQPIEEFAELFAVIPVPRSRLATVTFEWKEPELAARTLDFLLKEYMSDYHNRALGVTKEGLEALRRKAEQLRPQVEAKADELQRFMVENNMVSLEETQNIVVDRLKELSRNLTEVEKKRIEVESYYHSIQQTTRGEFRVEDLPEVARSQTIRDLKLEYIRAKQRNSDLGKSFGPNHPEVKAAKASLEAIQEKIEAEMMSVLSAVRSEYERIVKQEKELRKELADQEKRVMAFNQLAVRYKVLKDEAEGFSKTYNAVAKRIEEIEIATAAGSNGDNIFIIEHPTTPSKPVKPRKVLILSLATFFGIGLGIVLCFFAEYLDTTIKTKEDAESATGVPIIGYVPGITDDEITEAGNGSIAPIELHLMREPRSAVAEAFRSIRTALAFSGADGGIKSLMVTSPTRSEGKSFTSVNIAIVLAQAGQKVLLVDADLRRPRLHRIFRLNSSPGLSNVLAGEGVCSLSESVRPIESIENLSVLPSGPIPPNPAELLQSKRMRELVEELGERFDVIVFDTSPLVDVTDPAVLCKYVKNMIMVVRSFFTEKAVISRAMDIVNETDGKILGVVLNNVDAPRGSYNGYYCGYYYGNGDIKKTRWHLRSKKAET